ncbi:STAS domain-containing protein [Salipiger mucosus]|uniref:Anti-sigma factor antagonist n=1 Tax=Salipiger mucosus DSM 16094 TaxID=1123237 RepID=S9RNS6_9RHOB|nr:STAS domain-containing protein [Salipiger mucosus]EPX79740.1 anti-sigma F factor antagonist (spoIIAA-2), anti sigma b factor antagonist RsbV [Salipiger mucosus DSM 16094]
MDVTTHESDGLQVIRVEEARIDAAVAIQFKDRVRAAVAPGARRVVLDLGAVQFIDSSGLGAIVAAMKAMGEGQRLDLAGLTPMVDRVFRLTRMDAIFVIHDSVEGARGAS